MSDATAFDNARRAIASSHINDNSSLCAPFLTVLPVSGAAISVLAGPVAQSTVCSSDATAARLDELQFDLGEGPCWQALATRKPVLAEKVQHLSSPSWPLFQEALRSDGLSRAVSGMFAFPLVIGSLDIGAIDLYATSNERLNLSQVDKATALASLVAWQVLRRVFSVDPADATFEDEDSGSSRREVHQATGMVLAQLNISAEEAALLLRAHAFSTGQSVRELAGAIVERRFNFLSGAES